MNILIKSSTKVCLVWVYPAFLLLASVIACYYTFFVLKTPDSQTYLYKIKDIEHLVGFTTVSLAPGWTLLGMALSFFNYEIIFFIYVIIVGFYLAQIASFFFKSNSSRYIFLFSVLFFPDANAVIFTCSTVRETLALGLVYFSLQTQRYVTSLRLIAMSIHPAISVAFLLGVAKIKSLTKSLLYSLFFLILISMDIVANKFRSYKLTSDQFEVSGKICLLGVLLILNYLIIKNSDRFSRFNEFFTRHSLVYLNWLISLSLFSMIVMPSVGVRLFNSFYIIFPAMLITFIMMLSKKRFYR